MHPALSPAVLEAIAAEVDLNEEDLAGVVEEFAHEAAAESFNNGGYPDVDFWDAHDRVHNDADATASRINDDGLAAQLTYLTDGYTADQVRTFLRGRVTA